VSRAKQAILAVLNAPLRMLGVELVPSWRIQWWTSPATFQFGGREYPYFYHPYNCGWPPYANERVVEMSLANVWLGEQDAADVVEVGAVTPDYWPGRVHTVIDPYDPHERVTVRESVLDQDLSGRTVVSISTFEHIGSGDYGLAEQPGMAADALRKLFAESPRFLVTVPAGYNPSLDELLADPGRLPDSVDVGCLVRQEDGTWREAAAVPQSMRAYGDAALKRRFPGTCIGRWANSVVVARRGGLA